MNLTKKAIYVILIVIVALTSFQMCFNQVYAAESKKNNESKILGQADNLDEAMQGADDFLKKGKTTVDEQKLHNLSNMIYNTFLGIAIITAVIVGIIIGMKYMAGSAEGKAELKELLLPYIVGCFVVFGAFGIWKIAVTILSTWNN